MAVMSVEAPVQGRTELPGPRELPVRRPGRSVIVVGLLTLVAAALRFAVPRGLWGDEAISVGEAQLGFSTMIHTLRSNDVHPPLYFSLLWADIRLFGSGQLAVRIPSILAGTLIVPVVYITAKACLDRRAGYTAAVLATVSPLMVWYSQEARMYALYMLFALLAIWAQVRCLQDGRWRYWVTLSLAIAALFYNQYFGMLQVAAQALAFVAFMWTRRATPAGWRLLKRSVVSAALALLLIAPLVPYALEQFSRTAGHPFNGTTAAGGSGISVYSLFALVNWSLWGYHSNSVMADLNALWPGVMLISLLVLGRHMDYAARLLAWCIAVPIALLFVVGLRQPNLFDIRYVAGVVPALVVLAAVLIGRTARRRLTIMVVTTLLVGVSVVGLVNQQYSWGNPRLFDFHHTVEWVTQRYEPGDLVEFGPDGINTVIHYYGPHLSAQLVTLNPAAARAKEIFLLLAPPLYGTATTDEAVAYYQVSRGRKLVGHYEAANVDVWEFK